MTLLDTFTRTGGFKRSASRSLLATFNRFYDLWRQRQVLGKLENDILDDIGISHKDAATEARRPFWDAPSTWHD